MFADLCEKEPFLNTEEGAPFHSVFKLVRLQYIINDLASARILERDNILPPGLCLTHYQHSSLPSCYILCVFLI